MREDRPLGGFYQDFSDVLALVRRGVNAVLDPLGRPLSTAAGTPPHYNAIIVAQYGLACVPGARTGDRERLAALRAQADWLVEHQERRGAWRGFWLQRFDNAKYPALRAPWVSALAQGNAMSALLRAWEMLGDEAYLASARGAFGGLTVSMGEGGVLFESGDDLWLEEYPLDPPGHVLNGAIYALWGALDLARLTGDQGAWNLWRRGAATVARHVTAFDTGFWSRYELATPELTSSYYHRNIHIPQLEIMYRLTRESVFNIVAQRWRRHLRNPLSRARVLLEGRRRWRRSQAIPRRRMGHE